MSQKTYETLIAKLYEVPGSHEHMTKFSVLMADQILKLRKESGLTQAALIEKIKEQGNTITQSTLSRAESGAENVTAETYDKILQALGHLESITAEFSDRPKSRELVHS